MVNIQPQHTGGSGVLGSAIKAYQATREASAKPDIVGSALRINEAYHAHQIFTDVHDNHTGFISGSVETPIGKLTFNRERQEDVAKAQGKAQGKAIKAKAAATKKAAPVKKAVAAPVKAVAPAAKKAPTKKAATPTPTAPPPAAVFQQASPKVHTNPRVDTVNPHTNAPKEEVRANRNTGGLNVVFSAMENQRDQA